MKINLLSVLSRSLRELVFNVVEWRRRSVALLLLLCSVIAGQAAEISTNNPQHYNVKWDKERGRYIFEIRIYDFNGTDNWASRFRVSVKTGNIEEYIFVVDAGHQSKEGDINVMVKNCMDDKTGRLYSYEYDKFMPFDFVKEYNANETINGNNGFFLSNVKIKGDRTNHIFLYWYPSANKFIEKDLSFRLVGEVHKTSSLIKWSKDDTYGPVKSEFYKYTPRITNGELDYKTGYYKFKITVDNLNRYEGSNSDVTILTSADGKNWIKQKDLYFPSSDYEQELAFYSLTNYKESSTEFSLQELANGIFIKAVALSNPDGYSDNTGISNYKQEIESNIIRSKANARIENINGYISEKYAFFNWTTVNPTENADSQDGGKFLVEVFRNDEWEIVGEVDYLPNENNYSCSFPVTNEEFKVGENEMSLNIRRDVLASDAIFPLYMCQKYNCSYELDEMSVQIDSNVFEENVGVEVRNGRIVVTAEPGQLIEVFTCAGQRVFSGTADDWETEVSLPLRQIYIVRVGAWVSKVGL